MLSSDSRGNMQLIYAQHVFMLTSNLFKGSLSPVLLSGAHNFQLGYSQYDGILHLESVTAPCDSHSFLGIKFHTKTWRNRKTDYSH